MNIVNACLRQEDIFERSIDDFHAEFRLNVKHFRTMIGEKVVNFAVNKGSTLKCNICRKTFREFTLKFGH